MRLRTLLIEDNPANLELMSYLLRSKGHQVSVASDGHQGLNSALFGKYDVILCDIELPGMNGYEIAQQLKADATARTVPLVAVTAFAMPGDAQKAKSA